MIKVAVLDDYQNIFRELINIDKHKDKYDFTIFNQSFANENESLSALEEFEVLFVMRERTLISKSLISGIKNLKYIMTSGMRNKAIDLEETKKRSIIVCGTDINSNPAAEITWALILGLMRNMKQEIDNMFQGYWQTTVGFELKGKNGGLCKDKADQTIHFKINDMQIAEDTQLVIGHMCMQWLTENKPSKLDQIN